MVWEGSIFESVALKHTGICYLLPPVRRFSAQIIPNMMVDVYGKYSIKQVKTATAYMCCFMTFGVRCIQASSFETKLIWKVPESGSQHF